MKILFIQGASRIRVSDTNNFYVDGNFDNNVWKRYKAFCDELTVILRKVDKTFKDEDLFNKYNSVDTKIVNLKLVSDLYSPKINFFNIKIRKEIKEVIKNAVLASDRVIIRSVENFYTNTALKYCKKFNKKYAIEVTGFAFESFWYHSFLGKFLAIPREIKMKKSTKESTYTLYVTEKALQERYKNEKETVGCSNVELQQINEIDLKNRIDKINKMKEKNEKIILGTAAFLDVKWKGQQNVIKALSILKKNGITNFEYHLIGAGNGKYLKRLVAKNNLNEQVKFMGARNHEGVYEWLKDIDIYIQPSYQEGLCRAIVEAMSKACPVIASNAGGNSELIDSKYIYNKRSVKQLVHILKSIDFDDLYQQSKINFENSKKYKKDILDNRRNNFYKKFINS